MDWLEQLPDTDPCVPGLRPPGRGTLLTKRNPEESVWLRTLGADSARGAVAGPSAEGQSAQDVTNQKPVPKYHIRVTSFL